MRWKSTHGQPQVLQVQPEYGPNLESSMIRRATVGEIREPSLRPFLHGEKLVGVRSESPCAMWAYH